MTPTAFMQHFPEFRATSWDGWRSVFARLTPLVREFYAVAGRGGGKSRAAALLAACYACREYATAPGERIYIGVFAPDRRQARVTFRYISGLLRAHTAIAPFIESATQESLDLANGVTIEVLSANIAAPRGRSYAVAIVEEAAFLPTDEEANPDVELLRALRPALARVPGSLLAVVSSPYARRGVLWNAWRKYHGRPDSDVVFVQADTRELNPTFDARAIETAYAEDPVAAATEYGAQFRADIESFLSTEVVDDVTISGRRELPPRCRVRYSAFVDPSGGSADSFTLAIAHTENREDGQAVAVLDALREVRPPFSPEHAVADFALLLKTYGVARVEGDRYAGEWPRDSFRRHGVEYALCARSKSEIYRDALPIVMARRCELLDESRLRVQLVNLERRTARGGRDVIDHAPGARDDLANAVLGVTVNVLLRTRRLSRELTTRCLQAGRRESSDRYLAAPSRDDASYGAYQRAARPGMPQRN